ncbi:TPM domain-containing protein [Flavobacterium sp. GN10]|uniref:TPM domain-containing protein n=1 Tax=Flavobacterium tagetis TaxID=2801336 RepID=A0ABS1KEF2_9FLAO|nr:TPM domain-containing protein [Flavobacterium tagetis]MBL0737883.1 TPM domain-containing protein [Flavobacterium tagetis]
MRKLFFTILFLITITFNGQSIEKKNNNSEKQKVVATFREIYWNNLPKPKGWVNDYEGIFSDNEERKLDSIITNFEKETSIEIAVVTIDTIKVAKENFDDLSLHIAKTWAFGKKGKDNGILISFSKGYKKFRVELGDGTIKMLSEHETKEIIENDFIPKFLKGNYYQGMLDGIMKIIENLRAKIKKE